MYCPSRVGTIIPDQVALVTRNSGLTVVTMWNNNSGITTLSNPLNKNIKPINISNKPKRTIKTENGIIGIVLSNKD